VTYEAAGYDDRVRRNAELGLPSAVLLAPLWRRVVGQIVDQLVIIVPVAFIALMMRVRTADDLADKALAVNVVLVLMAFTYEWLMIGAWGRTVGKFALGVRAVRVDNAGPVPWSSSAIRALVPLAAGVIPTVGQFLTVVIYASAFFDRRRQGWHDKAAGTIVVMNAPT
jgi:uncharacterized RDD family membrane protein YckC